MAMAFAKVLSLLCLALALITTTARATTGVAANITSTGAFLQGTVNAANNSTTVSFDYGTTSNYGTNVAGTPSPVAGTIPTNVGATLTGLTPGTTYHYRVNGTSTAATINGNDATFTTLTNLQNWRQTYFNTTANSGNAADSFDFDGDGLPNLIKYAFGLNPISPVSRRLPQPVYNGTSFTISFTSPAGVSGITYGADWTSSLNPPNWQPVSDTGSGTQHIFSVPVNGHPSLFLRLRVSDP
jgi:hypothetical protein